MATRSPAIPPTTPFLRNILALSAVVLLFLAGCRQPTVDGPIEAAPSPVGQINSTEMEGTAVIAATPSPIVTSSPVPSVVMSETAMPTLTATATASNTPSPTPTPSATPCSSRGEVVSGTMASAHVGGQQGLRVYLPPCYRDDGGVYPTLYLFAGDIHNEGKWDQLGVDDAADAAILAGEIAPFLIVMPAGGWLANETSGGPGSYEAFVLDELIPYVEQNYCAWQEPAGRAIGGLSRGGYWALEIAFRSPERFASVGGHSAALLDQFAGPDVNPQYTALTRDLGDLRVYLDIGSDDYLRPNTVRLHEDMEAAGVPHVWVFQEGRHQDAYWSAHVGEYLRWYAEPWALDRATYPPCER